MPKYRIEGTVHAAGGFSYVVDAANERTAERVLRRRLEGASVEDLNRKNGFEVQEVCVESTEQLPDDMSLAADLTVPDTTTIAEDVIAATADNYVQEGVADRYAFAKAVLEALRGAGLEVQKINKG